MNASKKKGDEYYPIRWKLADFVENIIILHRTRAALFIAALGVLLIIAGAFVIGWRPWGSDDAASNQDQIEAVEDGDQSADGAQSNGIRGSDTQSTDTEPPNVDAELAATSRRPVATAGQFAVTQPGLVIQLGPAVMSLNGGFPSDTTADAAATRANELFPTREIFDAQVLSQNFVETDEVIIRIIEPNLFVGDTTQLNPDFSPLIADISQAIFSSGENTVEIVGHYPDLIQSEARAQAAADALIAEGVVSNIISVSGRGNTEPIPGIEGRLEFVIR